MKQIHILVIVCILEIVSTYVEAQYAATKEVDALFFKKLQSSKKECNIFMKIRNDQQTYYCHFVNSDLHVIEEGRIGLRLMFTRSSHYANLKYSN